MPILDLQRRLAEVGRIRIGQQVKTSKGTRPAKLDYFRLTSADRTRIEQASRLYGGDVAEWEAPAGKQFEVITKTDTLPVVVPPSDMAFTQFYESWSGGGCQRRCDGVNESISEGPCLCDPDARECKIHSRLSVMLRDLPGLGVWRIDSSGYFAGVELQGAVEVVKLAAGRGQMLPAVLRLEQRQVKRVDEQVKRFAVPVLDLLVSPAQLLGGGDMLSIEPPRDGLDNVYTGPLDSPPHLTPALLTPVPETVPQQPARTVKEQTEPPPKKKPRKNAAKSIPPTGIKPRTAAQASKDSSGLTAGKSGERAAGKGMPPPDEPDPWGPAPPPPDNWVSPNKPSEGRPLVTRHLPDDSPAEVDERTKLNRQMHALFRKAGIEKDRRDDRLTITRYITKQHEIQSSNDLPLDRLRNLAETLAGWDRDGTLGDDTAELLNQAAIDQWQQQEETRP